MRGAPIQQFNRSSLKQWGSFESVEPSFEPSFEPLFTFFWFYRSCVCFYRSIATVGLEPPLFMSCRFSPDCPVPTRSSFLRPESRLKIFSHLPSLFLKTPNGATEMGLMPEEKKKAPCIYIKNRPPAWKPCEIRQQIISIDFAALV